MTPHGRAKAPVSRRDRPAKPALSRQGIIDAALVIMRDEGLGKVTMRRIAAALDTGAASLYVYVRNTEDLHTQILDSLLAPVTEDLPADGPWRDRLKALLTAYGRVLTSHPEIARMALSTQPSGPNYLALANAVLGLLVEGGVSDRVAAWGVDLLMLHPTAVAVEQSGRTSSPRRGDDMAQLATRIADADATRFPHVARIGADLLSGDGESRTDWAFDVLIDGLLGSRQPPRQVVPSGEHPPAVS
ncbi:TetR/AcrR family transcriptional regulator [Umezawaea sp.]|uniref:TetR/AcrR family transcriptional regulator n=1 Tax=Umezawaea sp. TaxID=1955258 RepID=UPI002ED5F534